MGGELDTSMTVRSEQKLEEEDVGESPRGPAFAAVVERALREELTRRRGLLPYAQLAIAPKATAAAIEEAFGLLRARYDPQAFEQYGPATVATAREISELLRVARQRMSEPSSSSEIPKLPALDPAPRRDETLRALETLRGAIARRLSEAETHRQAGRLQEAARSFEAVLVLDRANACAREALQQLRQAMKPVRPSLFTRLFRPR